MKRARIFHDGRAHWGQLTSDGAAIELKSGITVSTRDAHWLAPITPGATAFALGLNYADHSKELGFAKPQSKPLVFLKGKSAFVGHRGTTPRPGDANQMHPECELVAVIGTPARCVSRADAMSHVSGYTVACDYAIREYLENFYRPNLRVKSRDGSTPLGPWIVDAADIPDPAALALTTTVNGREVQRGATADMVFDIPFLVEYLSSFMTLLPGDMILTGTPHGIHFCQAGDEVVCDVEGVGQLVNTLVSV